MLQVATCRAVWEAVTNTSKYILSGDPLLCPWLPPSCKLNRLFCSKVISASMSRLKFSQNKHTTGQTPPPHGVAAGVSCDNTRKYMHTKLQRSEFERAPTVQGVVARIMIKVATHFGNSVESLLRKLGASPPEKYLICPTTDLCHWLAHGGCGMTGRQAALRLNAFRRKRPITTKVVPVSTYPTHPKDSLHESENYAPPPLSSDTNTGGGEGQTTKVVENDALGEEGRETHAPARSARVNRRRSCGELQPEQNPNHTK